MGMTMAEKILARASGQTEVKPGEYIWAKVDGTAIIGGRHLKRLESLGVEKLFDADRIYVTEDHMAPAHSVESANSSADMRRMVKKYGISHFFEWGRHGILHELFPNHGYCSPGEFIASIDSHSTSYGCFNVASCPVNEELIYIIITGELWLRVPPSIRFVINGRLPGRTTSSLGRTFS